LHIAAISESTAVPQASFLAPKIAQPKAVLAVSSIPTTAQLQDFLKQELALYGIEDDYPTLAAVIQCESGWNISPKPNYISWGIAEYTPATWKDVGFGNIMNPYSQLSVMAKIWAKQSSRWDCFRLELYKKYLL